MPAKTAVSRAAQENVNALLTAGLDRDDVDAIQIAIKRLRDYELLGSLQDFVMFQKRSDVLATYIQMLPEPMQQAWVQHLTIEGVFS